MNWIFYGLIFVGYGIWTKMRERKARAPHSHRCWNCGTLWTHDPSKMTDDEHDDAHACPRCGAFTFKIDPGLPQKGAAPVSSPAPVVAQTPPQASVRLEPAPPSAAAPGGEVEKPAGAHNPSHAGATPAPATVEKKPQ